MSLVPLNIGASDAHTHLQNVVDAGDAVHSATCNGVRTIAVCATHRGDWDDVALLSEQHNAVIIPNFGIHPWWATAALHTISSSERDRADSKSNAARVADESPRLAELMTDLEEYLQRHLNAHVGEIGLDRTKRGLAVSAWGDQVPVFNAQLRIAAKHQRVISVHCVQAHSHLVDLLASALATSTASSRSSDDDVAALPSVDGPRLGGLLLHSWAGGPAVAAQLLNLPCIRGSSGRSTSIPAPSASSTRLPAVVPREVPVLFSFVGSIATAVSNEFVTANASVNGAGAAGASAEGHPNQDSREHPAVELSCSCGAGPAGAAQPDLAAAGDTAVVSNIADGVSAAVASSQPPGAASADPAGTQHLLLPRGAGKECLKCLERLPHSQIVFETDSPDQAFMHALDPRYLQWVNKAFSASGDDESDAAVESRLPDHIATAATAGTADADGKSNRPQYLHHIIRAAAIWRVAHGSRPEGAPLQQKPGTGPARRKAEGKQTPAGGCARTGELASDAGASGASSAQPGVSFVPDAADRFAFFRFDQGQQGTPYAQLPALLQGEYRALCAASTDNVRRVFGIATVPDEGAGLGRR